MKIKTKRNIKSIYVFFFVFDLWWMFFVRFKLHEIQPMFKTRRLVEQTTGVIYI